MIMAVAILGLPSIIDGLRLDGTISDISNASLDSTVSSSTIGNDTEDVTEPAVNVAIKVSDTKSTPPPL